MRMQVKVETVVVAVDDDDDIMARVKGRVVVVVRGCLWLCRT
jgi:hypothetical protein